VICLSVHPKQFNAAIGPLRVTALRSGACWEKKNNKMPKVVKFLILGASCLALLVLVVFIAWATQLNPLITVSAVLSAAYLSYVAAYLTILK
jgi:hypothetical protein